MLGNLRGAQILSIIFVAGAAVFIFIFKLWTKDEKKVNVRSFKKR
jgi:hypothetical protein